MIDELLNIAVFGISGVAIPYWLLEHAKRVGLITNKKVKFLFPGLYWALLVVVGYINFTVAKAIVVVLGLWVATLAFKSGAKDNENKPSDGGNA
jgi:hypothetical protein